MSWKKHKPVFDENLPFRAALRDLDDRPPRWPARRAILPFARHNLGIRPEHEQTWYRAACWGYSAHFLYGRYLQKENRADQIRPLIEPVDWTPLERSLASGKGVILVSAHLGPARIARFALLETTYPVLALTDSPASAAVFPNSLLVDSKAGREQSLVRGLIHLRRNGVLLAAPDGKQGAKKMVVRCANQEVRFSVGIGELARLSGAVTCWFSGTWVAPDRIRVVIEPIPAPQGEGEAWLEQWYRAYFERLWDQIRNNPADLGFRDGIWDTERSGLRWNYDLRQRIRRTIDSITSAFRGRSGEQRR
ncbi:hypothetical protein EZJ19_05015 [Parasulfuritortus cantonensis]|uniref:Lysophospholipid acyltransferase family protein n=1 Tax=Parasulfuritortus cantonensis TaxID=2528202 RepID=A0A4R1BGF6_9PROT|nr:hypothetical protein [Parasulfuritortus cantonensis]TCJ16269.1 hypothetical protein EZJ19_05015 [Parasulfuritortus cantonensis]